MISLTHLCHNDARARELIGIKGNEAFSGVEEREMSSTVTNTATPSPPAPPSHGSALGQGITWVYLSLIFQAAVKFVVVVVLTRLLNPTDFGLVGIAMIFTSIAERFGTVGVGPSVIQRETLTGNDRHTATVLSILSGFVVAMVLWGVAPYVALYFRQPPVEYVLKALALGFCVDGFAVIPEALLQRELQIRRLMIIENVGYTVGHVVVGITLAFYGYGVWSLVAANLSLRIIRLIGLVTFSPRRSSDHGVFSLASARMLVNRGVGFSLGRILNFFSLQGDAFVVGRLLGAEMLGMYNRAYQLMALPAMYVGQVFDRILFPALAQQQGDRARVRRSFLASLELVTIVALPTAVGMFLAADDIILALFGERWREVIPVLSVLSLGVFFRTAYKCSDTMVKSLGAVYEHALRQALYTVLVVGGSVLGALTIGLPGVAWAVVLAVATHYVVITHLGISMVGATWSDVIRAHIPGVWMAGWIMVALLLVNLVPAFQHEMSAVTRLSTDVAVAALVACLVYYCSYGFVRGEMLPMLVGRLLHRPREGRSEYRAA